MPRPTVPTTASADSRSVIEQEKSTPNAPLIWRSMKPGARMWPPQSTTLSAPTRSWRGGGGEGREEEEYLEEERAGVDDDPVPDPEVILYQSMVPGQWQVLLYHAPEYLSSVQLVNCSTFPCPAMLTTTDWAGTGLNPHILLNLRLPGHISHQISHIFPFSLFTGMNLV